mmetsp:Transcript_80807/g.174671  ORF Transcript_80807/g.174671 Transcript_80807/m.174671 type:complete len:745 (+) Transcript_80807:148-2382(+)
MSHNTFDVLGRRRFAASAPCPEKLQGSTLTLRSSDGATFRVGAEAACVSQCLLKVALSVGVEQEFALSLKQKVVEKAIEYMEFHRDTPPAEVATPLGSDNLVECGVLEWDAEFVRVPLDDVFDLMLAASILDIPSLLWLTGAWASHLVRGKSPDTLREEFGYVNDMPPEEEEMVRSGFVHGKRQQGLLADPCGLGGCNIVYSGVLAAAARNGIQDPHRPVQALSWRLTSWRALVSQDWTQLARAPTEVAGDRALLWSTLKKSRGTSMRHASQELRRDRALVLEAARFGAESFGEAAEELRSDRDFVWEVLQVNPEALAGAAQELRRDRPFVLHAARQGMAAALSGADQSLRKDVTFMLSCVELDPSSAKHVLPELGRSKAFALAAVGRSGAALRHLSARFRADRDVVEAAVEKDPMVAVFAHVARRAELRRDLDGSPPPARSEEASAHGEVALVWAVDHEQAALQNGSYGLSKCVFFSAISTWSGNVGQGNYGSANIFMEKLPAYRQPEINGTTLLWGPVGSLGMRWKAFASADVLNYTPETLFSMADASQILMAVTTKVAVPEYLGVMSMDAEAREAVWRGMRRGLWRPERVKQQAEDAPESDLLALPAQAALYRAGGEESGPLLGWPGLQHPENPQDDAPGPSVGSRVRLKGLGAKSGRPATLLAHSGDRSWLLRVDGGSGLSTVKECYFDLLLEVEDLRDGDRDLDLERRAKDAEVMNIIRGETAKWGPAWPCLGNKQCMQ